MSKRIHYIAIAKVENSDFNISDYRTAKRPDKMRSDTKVTLTGYERV